MIILIGAFWPGSDSAGPNQSVRGLCTALSDSFDFRIVARDRPFGSENSVADAGGDWHDRGYAKFRYCQVAPMKGASGLRRILRETPHELLIANGFFDREFTLPALFMRRAGMVPKAPTIVSTRGEFAGGALGLKSGRKRAMMALARRAGLHRDVWLHGTSAAEAADIERGYPFSRGVLVAPNVRVLRALPPMPEPAAGDAPLRLAFVGRVSPVKNLDYAIRALRDVKTRVSYDIFGPVQDAGYWATCQELIADLPEHVTVTHKGEVANEQITEVLAAYDLLYLPTKGENFGHAILDALEAGVPALISDQTPFRGLEAQEAGFDLPLDDPAGFARAIDRFAALASPLRDRWRNASRRLAERTVSESNAVGANRDMFETAMGEDNRVAA